MKKMKAVALMAVLALSATAFVACSEDDGNTVASVSSNWSAVKLSEVYETKYVASEEENKATGEQLTQYDGYSVGRITDNSYYSRNNAPVSLLDKTVTSNTQYKLYNWALDAEIASFKINNNGESISFAWVTDNNYGYRYAIEVTKTNFGSTTVSYYSLDGVLLGTGNDISFSFNGTQTDEDGNTLGIFTKTKGNASTKYSLMLYTGETEEYEEENAGDNEITDFEYDYDLEGEKFNYMFDYSAYKLYMYDKTSNALKKTADFSGPYENVNVLLLNNETFAVQSVYLEEGDATDYTFATMYNGETFKYTVKTYIYNPQDDSKTEVVTDYMLGETYNSLLAKMDGEEELEAFNNRYVDTIENLASVQRISERRLVNDERKVVLKNSLELVGTVDEYIPRQYGEVTLIAEGLFSATDSNYSNGYYLDAEGKIIGQMVESVSSNPNFIVTGNAVYTYDGFEKLIDFTEDGVRLVYSNFNGGIVVAERIGTEGAEKYILYTADDTDGREMFRTDTCASYAVLNNYNVYYTVKEKNGAYEYIYYSADGTKLLTYKNTYSTVEIRVVNEVQNGNGGYMLGYFDEDATGETVRKYIRFEY